MGLTIIKTYKKSIKFLCLFCGNVQMAKLKSRCHRHEICSQCLQKQYELGKVAYWG